MKCIECNTKRASLSVCVNEQNDNQSQLPSGGPSFHLSSTFAQLNFSFPSLMLTSLCRSHNHLLSAVREATSGGAVFKSSPKSKAQDEHGYKMGNERISAIILARWWWVGSSG